MSKKLSLVTLNIRDPQPSAVEEATRALLGPVVGVNALLTQVRLQFMGNVADAEVVNHLLRRSALFEYPPVLVEALLILRRQGIRDIQLEWSWHANRLSHEADYSGAGQ